MGGGVRYACGDGGQSLGGGRRLLCGEPDEAAAHGKSEGMSAGCAFRQGRCGAVRRLSGRVPSWFPAWLRTA